MDSTQPERRDHVPLAEGAHEKTSPALLQLLARIAELKRDLLDRDRDCTFALKQIKKLNQRLREREAELERRHRELQRCHGDIAELSAAVTRIEESKSWKLTAPVRLLGKMCRHVIHSIRRIRGPQSGTPFEEPSRSELENLPTLVTSEQLEVPQGADSSTSEPFSRVEILEEALLDLLGSLEDTSGDGRYIHRIPHNIDTRLLTVKAIAFYRSQSSETNASGVLSGWTSVSTAVPRYFGQYQPHVPDALGYYDLRLGDVLKKQVELANQYGVYGFCFQYGPATEIAHDPVLTQLLSDATLDIAFCISCEDTITHDLDNQAAEVGSHDGLWATLSKAFTDPRYLLIDGKPVLLVSKVRDGTLQGWRHIASVLGLSGLYLVARCELPPREAISPDFDAIMEDPTLGVDVNALTDVPLIDVNFRGDIYNYSEIMERSTAPVESPHVTFRTVVTGWDTEPSSRGKSSSFAGSSPALYARWLERCCSNVRQRRPQERFVFVNSWNDWMAGAHLEPDHRFGYAYLNATANVLRSYYCDEATEQLVKNINAKFSPSSDTAIIFHCFHEDLIRPIFEEYFSKVAGADLIVTTRADISYRAVEEMSQRFGNIFIDVHENRGRDIRPFLFALRRVQSLGYRFACKVHTKKTPHARDGEGELWRQTLMKKLLGASDSALQVRRRFDAEKDIGLLVPSGSLMDLHELRHHIDNTFWLDRLLDRMNRTDLIENYSFSFLAGSMFWFRVDALAGLDDLVLGDDAFEQELGQRDGTLAHALERLIVLHALQKGYQTEEIDVTKRSYQREDPSRPLTRPFL